MLIIAFPYHDLPTLGQFSNHKPNCSLYISPGHPTHRWTMGLAIPSSWMDCNPLTVVVIPIINQHELTQSVLVGQLHLLY